MRTALTALAMTLWAAPALAASAQAEGYKKLNAAQIRSAFTGRSFSDEVHFSYAYKADGKIIGVSMGRKVTNAWAIEKDRLCITDGFGRTCHIVWKKAAAVRLTLEDSDFALDGVLR